MSDSFNTTPANWQGVDEKPKKNSNNVIISGGVFNNMLAVNLLGCTNYICAGYVNIYGDLVLDSNNFVESDADYKLLIVPVDTKKQYKYFNNCTNLAAVNNIINYGYYDSNFNKLQNTVLRVNAKQWTDLVIPENAAYFAMTIEFKDYSEPDDYRKSCVVEVNKYYQTIESEISSAKESVLAIVNRVKNSLSEGNFSSNNISSLTSLNKALAYITSLGTTQRCYNGYINDPSRELNLMDGPATDYQTIIAKVTPGENYDCFIYCSPDADISSSIYKYYLGGIAFYDENLLYIGGYSVKSKNTWMQITAIENAVYIAVVCKFGEGYGDYTKCYFGQKNLKNDKEFNSINSSISKINNTVNIISKDVEFAKSEFPQRLFLKNGYVTSSGITNPINIAEAEDYQVLVIPVKEGEIYHYKMVETQGSNANILNCYANENLTAKVPAGNNLTLAYGENTITIPSGVSYLCLTIKFGGNTSYEGASLYLEGSFEDRIKSLENNKSLHGLGVRVRKTGTSLYIATKWDDNNYLVQTMVCHRPISSDSNPNANLLTIKKVPYSSDVSASGTLLKQAGDDICPAFVNGSYIAGNHGWNVTKNITCENHGKTVADVGAEYKDSNDVKFYILRILDNNTIQVVSENKGSDGTYDFREPSGVLVYQSNGFSNTDIVISSVSSVGNFYGSVFEASYKLMGDNKNIIEDGLYNFKEFTLLENYDVADMPTVISALYNNRPENGYIEQPVFQNLEGVEKLFNRSVSYKFMSNGTCLVGTSLMAYKKCYLSFDGVVQSMYGGNRMYIPKLNSFVHDGVTYDFRKIEQWTSFYGRSFDSSSWENPNVSPDRFVNFDTNNKFSIMLGYILDKGLEFDRNTITTTGYGAVYLASTLKLYPMAISDGRTLNVGDKYSVLAYRATSNHTFNPTGRTNLASVRVNNAIFVYIDYHGTLIDKIPVDDDWVGKDITIIEKTTNISLLTEDCVVGPIVINSQATVNNYGYIVLKLTD